LAALRKTAGAEARFLSSVSYRGAEGAALPLLLIAALKRFAIQNRTLAARVTDASAGFQRLAVQSSAGEKEDTWGRRGFPT